ncbi:MAG: Ig-like domain-containing protein [Lentimicrobiaceae bacterium]
MKSKFTLIALAGVLAFTACKKDKDEPETLTLDKTEITLQHNIAQQLNVTPTQTCTWTSADTNVAKVTQAGLVTGVRLGNTKITAKAASGLIAECNVTVEAASFLYKEPAYKYGESIAYVKSKETRFLLNEDLHGLAYQGENSDVSLVVYIFDNDALMVADVMLNDSINNFPLAQKFLEERYIYLGTQDGVVFYMDYLGNFLGLSIDDNLGLNVLYYTDLEVKQNRNIVMEGYLKALKQFKR